MSYSKLEKSEVLNGYMPFNKDGFCSVYTSFIYAKTKQEALKQAKEIYGSECHGVELREKNVTLTTYSWENEL